MQDLSRCMQCIAAMLSSFAVPQRLIQKLVAQDERGTALLMKVIRSDLDLRTILWYCRAMCDQSRVISLFPRLISAILSYPDVPVDVIEDTLEYARGFGYSRRHQFLRQAIDGRPLHQIIRFVSPQYIMWYYHLTSDAQGNSYALCLVGELLIYIVRNHKLPQELAADLISLFIKICQENKTVLDFVYICPLLSAQNPNLTAADKERIYRILLDNPYSASTLNVILHMDCPAYFVRTLAEMLLNEPNGTEVPRDQYIKALLNKQSKHLEEHIRVALELLCPREHDEPIAC